MSRGIVQSVLMIIKSSDKRFIRLETKFAVRQLRTRLGISQALLAEMVGSAVSMMTVSRWERGELLPYPKNRRKLAEIALSHDWWDIAAALHSELSFDQWLSVVEENLPEEYRLWMILSMCALYRSAFQPDDPDDPSHEEIEFAKKEQDLSRTARELLDRLVKLHEAGKQMILAPPLSHFRRFWWGILSRTTGRGSGRRRAR